MNKRAAVRWAVPAIVCASSVIGILMLVIPIFEDFIHPEGISVSPLSRELPASAPGTVPNKEALLDGVSGEASANAPRKDSDLAYALVVQATSNLRKDAQRSLIKGEWVGYWQQEDLELASLLPFDEYRADFAAKAKQYVAENGLSLEDPAALCANAQEAINDFWRLGGLNGKDAYLKVYASRALVELALEANPTQFDLLETLKHLVSTTEPLKDVDLQLRASACQSLLPIVERQKALVVSGAASPNAQSFGAMIDWIQLKGLDPSLSDPRELLPAWQWLVANAERGGWGHLKRQLEDGVQNASKGQLASLMPVYFYDTSSKAPRELLPIQVRRLRSYRGSSDMQQYCRNIASEKKLALSYESGVKW